jgi:Tfp pilus assembly protein PilE
MTSGDEAFNKKDYKSAEIYYKNVLKYTDEVETNFINARLEISKEKIPEQKRRAVYHNALIIVIIIAILSAIGYLGYYTFILKEDRDYSELVKSDNARDLKTMETMIGKYENFLRSYTNGKNKKRAIDRINQYSYQIASIYYKDDWKLALRHFNKIENTLDQEKSKNLKTNIYNTAFNEYKQKLSNAKKLNSISKYSESLNELNNAINIVSSFPGTDMTKETEIIQSNMTLLNKKISSILKINDIEREIREKEKELSGISSSGNSGTVLLTARITGFSEPDIYLSRESESGKTVAVRNVKQRL